MRVLLVLIAICFYSQSLFGQDLYVGDSTNGRIEVFDGTTGRSKGIFAGNGELAGQLSITFGGPSNDLYIGSFSGEPFNPQILRYNGSTGEFIESLVTIQPTRIFFGDNGDLYYTGTQFSGVRRYDVDTGATSDFIANGQSVSGATLDSNGDVYLSYSDIREFLPSTGEIGQYDGNDGAFVRTLVSHDEPDTRLSEIVFGPDGNPVS